MIYFGVGENPGPRARCGVGEPVAMTGPATGRAAARPYRRNAPGLVGLPSCRDRLAGSTLGCGNVCCVDRTRHRTRGPDVSRTSLPSERAPVKRATTGQGHSPGPKQQEGQQQAAKHV